VVEMLEHKLIRRKKMVPAIVVTLAFATVKMLSKRYPAVDEISHYLIAGYLAARIWLKGV
jgi:hypothetical protein